MGPYGYMPNMPGPNPPPSFWSQWCSARGAALTHAHWDQCDARHTDPKHSNDQCCHCGMRSSEWREAELKAAEAAREPQAAGAADHDFIFTVTGRCGRIGCSRVEADHPKRLAPSVMKAGECPVDHNSVTPGLVIGDAGLDWKTCPSCGVRLEAKAILGKGATGVKCGPGRGVITNRSRNRLEAIKWRFTAGGEER